MILSLEKMAFEQLQKGNLIFCKADLKECSIAVEDGSVYASVLTQIFREDCGLNQDKHFSFVHLSFQQFLAAFHVIERFVITAVNLLSEEQSNAVYILAASASSLQSISVRALTPFTYLML